MKIQKLIGLLISGVVVISAAGCQQTSKTSADAPSSVNETVKAPTQQTAQKTQNDATSETRKKQLESDIRAREQRNNITDSENPFRDDDDLESEVRDKLEANLPASQLTVEADDGAVTVAGTVPTQAQLNKISALAQEIKGVESVKVNVKVAPAKNRKPGSVETPHSTSTPK